MPLGLISPRSLAWSVLFFIVGVAAAEASSTERESAACHALAQVLLDGRDFEPLDRFDAARLPENPLGPARTRALLLSPERWSGPPPGAELVDRLLRSRAIGLSACLAAQRTVAEVTQRRAATSRTVEVAGEPIPPPAHFYVSATMPVLNRSGDGALFFVDRQGDAIGGYLKVVHIAKRHGVWRRLGEKYLRVS